MATTLKKQFLDYAGLQQFWGIIDAKFATKLDAAKVGTFNFETTDASVTMTYSDCAASPKTYDIAIPMATDENAGMISASDKALIDDIDNKINDMAPFHGLKIEGKEINLPGKRGNIGLRFDTSGSVENGTREAFIELVDLAYPTDADGNPYSWSTVDAAEYEANSTKPEYYAHNGSYYKWSQAGVEGPINNVGEPLMSQPISRIDVSELVKAGLLQDADVVLKDDKMQLQLVFITNGAGTETKTVYIDVTDLVDIYTEGEGIEITNSSMTADGAQKEGTIKLRVANYDPENSKNELGGVRVGYTTDDTKQQYKVQLDASGNAFVAVPWAHTVVTASSEGKNATEQAYLTTEVTTATTKVTDVNGSEIITTTYNINVEAGDGLKAAEGLAGTSIQTVEVGAVAEDDATVSKDAYIKVATEQMTNEKGQNIGKIVTAELTDSAKASLALADTSVQGVKTSNVDRSERATEGEDLVVTLVKSDGNTAYDNTKGEKNIKVTLGDKTVASLDKADSAMQTITIMGTTLNIDDSVYDTDEAVQALSLGSAANVNTVDVMPAYEVTEANDGQFKSEVTTAEGTKEARYTVATAKAVKKYVDDENKAQSETLRGYTDEKIEGLDSSVEVTTGSSDHADYYAAYGADAAPHQVMIGVTQTDGVLTAASPYILSITDIADFAPLSSQDILNICNETAGE